MQLKTILLAAALVSAPAHAQYRTEAPTAPGYRPGQPQVLAAPPPENPEAQSQQATTAFRRWYASAQRPALLIFWNRELSDQATTQYAEVSTTREQVQGTPESGAQSKVAMQEAYRRAMGPGQYAALDPMLSARLETAFQAAWLQSGVEVVDRTALIRKMSTVASKEDRADTQLLESVALEQGVQYLVEVLPNATQSSPTGFNFLVKVKHLPSSTVMAQFLSAAQPPAGPSRWAATPGGFEKRTENRTTPETVGAQLAVETMGRLVR